MDIRLIASDLDGTLLGADRQLSARTVAAIRAIIDAGIEFIPATGRGFRSTLDLLRPVGTIDTVVCSNGALVYDLRSDRIASTRPIEGDEARAIVAALRRAIPEARLGWETTEAVSFDPGFHPRYADGLPGQPIDDVAAALKLFVSHPELSQPDLRDAVLPHLPHGAHATTSGAPFLEVTAADVDKSTTVALLAAERGIEPTQVMAFGDQMNDITMLQWAGIGVAMGNARPETKAVADRHADSHDRDGVARILEQLARD